MRLKVTTARTNELKGYCGQSWALLNEGGLSRVAAVKRRTRRPALASAFFSFFSIPAVTDMEI